VVDESTAVIPNQQQACLVSMQVELHEELNQSNYGQDKVQSNLSEQLVVRNDNAVVECGKSKKASLNSKKATESSTAVSRNESLSLIDVSMQVNNCGKDNYENEDETSSCEEEILLDEVNVSKLVDNITKKLANLNMTVPDLAKLLGIGRRALQLRFKDRLPWASLQLPSKLVFLKLNAWYEGKDIDLKTRKFSIGHTKLVKRVNGLLKRKNMSVKKLAEELDIKPLSSLARLLNDPKPWDTLNEAKRIISRKLYTWYIDNDGGKVVEDDSPDREELNVEELVRNVRGILKCTGIQVKELANMIGKSGKSMGGFLTYPSRWDMLTRVTQDQYRELNIWYVKTMADITSGKLAVNTRYFVKHVETLLLRIGVSVEDMIKEVGIERDLFNFPLPWQDLNNAQRKQFLKLNAWCVSQKDDLITAADEKVLDINELNEKVRRLLKRLKLSIKEVAVTLGISTTTLSELLNSKLPWEFLGRVSKDHYLRLNAWFVKSTSNKPL
jgi:predicted XRE-type DNA-binding protein